MEFSFTVTCAVERTTGKFASREDIAEQIIDSLNGADPMSMEGENGGEYETTSWSVQED